MLWRVIDTLGCIGQLLGNIIACSIIGLMFLILFVWDIGCLILDHNVGDKLMASVGAFILLCLACNVIRECRTNWLMEQADG